MTLNLSSSSSMSIFVQSVIPQFRPSHGFLLHPFIFYFFPDHFLNLSGCCLLFQKILIPSLMSLQILPALGILQIQSSSSPQSKSPRDCSWRERPVHLCSTGSCPWRGKSCSRPPEYQCCVCSAVDIPHIPSRLMRISCKTVSKNPLESRYWHLLLLTGLWGLSACFKRKNVLFNTRLWN